MVKAKKWTMVKAWDKAANMSNFKLEEEILSDTLGKGEVLCEAVYLTVDPYMRLMPGTEGKVMMGEQVAKITKSENPDFPTGTHVTGMLGWRTHTVVPESTVSSLTKVTDIGQHPLSLHLGALGMPGMTAYFGFMDGCEPKEGETVFVSSAAGAVGSMVSQIAKIKGCHVIGSAGTDEKCKWLKTELGVDESFNYKTDKLDEALKRLAPKGIDCYFDNVGGEFASTVIENMAYKGRVACCGSISTYQAESSKGSLPYVTIIVKLLTLRGVQGWATKENWPKGQAQLLHWIKEGKLKVKETVTDGFDNMATAFLDLFKGGNIGKAIIKV